MSLNASLSQRNTSGVVTYQLGSPRTELSGSVVTPTLSKDIEHALPAPKQDISQEGAEESNVNQDDAINDLAETSRILNTDRPGNDSKTN